MLEILQNEIIISVFIATFLCQVWKVLHKLIWEKKFEWGIFFATGGMPSSHTTFVVALALSVGFAEGFLSTLFLIALGLAMVVVRDAVGVRRIVDNIIRLVNDLQKEKDGMKIIKKIAGHTPFQVLVGFLLGIVVTVAIHYIMRGV